MLKYIHIYNLLHWISKKHSNHTFITHYTPQNVKFHVHASPFFKNTYFSKIRHSNTRNIMRLFMALFIIHLFKQYLLFEITRW